MPHTKLILLASLLALAGCVSAPPGPSTAVMRAPGKPFEQFAAEQQVCRDYAQHSVGLSPAEAGARDVAGSAVIGTAIGAAVGALAGGHRGAGVGAAFGLVTGTAVGANQGELASSGLQRRYDIAYEQCMYAKGNQLPSYDYRHGYRQARPSARYQYQAPANYPPPPPQQQLLPPPPPPQSGPG